MAICRICDERYYNQSYYEPEEPCICGHRVNGESPWQYAGWRGVLARWKYTYLRKAFEAMTSRFGNWLYKEWKY
jgi:hypothetical protein